MGAQEDHARFSEIADDLQLEDDERESFIASAMQRKGYKPSTAWNDPEPENDDDDGKGGGDFFSAKREKKQQREKRDVSGGGEQKRERFGY